MKPVDLSSLLRGSAPVFDREAARLVVELTEQLVHIEETTLSKFCSEADAANYIDKTAQLHAAMGQLGLGGLDLNLRTELSEFVGNRIMESIIGRTGKDEKGEMFFFSGSTSTELPARTTLTRRLPK